MEAVRSSLGVSLMPSKMSVKMGATPPSRSKRGPSSGAGKAFEDETGVGSNGP